MANTTLTLTDSIPAPPLGEHSRSKEALDVYGILGAGGMGVVQLAQQLSVDRPVAVKTLRDNDVDDIHREQLVREGWVLGQLEHPNIPPIYSITTHDNGPAIVFKRIQGEQWSTYLDKTGLLGELLGVSDPLEWHLGVLLKVVDAVRFAHSRGILHRDLKPSNVMIGEFGEVYLMDWGLAVSTRPEHEGAVQLARDVFQTSGTYCYMAPEMLEPQAMGITERTDIYQLGGLLYHICMGRPPHDGDDWFELERRIRRSRPRFGNGLPTELILICRRALQADPEKRFESADELRLSLEAFRSHRGANDLSNSGGRILRELAERRDITVEQRAEVHQILAQCRFAFQQSLEIWPSNTRALEGLAHCATAAAEFELSAGEPEQALALLDGHRESQLLARCRAACAAKRVEEAAMERLRRRRSRDFDSKGRRAAIVSIAVLWSILPAILKVSLDAPTYAQQASSQFAFLSLWLLVGRLKGKWIETTDINTRSFSMVLAATILALVGKLGAFTMGVPADMAQVYDLFVFFTAGLLTSFLIDWRMWPTAATYLVAFVFAAYMPNLCLWAMAGSNAVLATTAVLIWRDCVAEQGVVYDCGKTDRAWAENPS